MPNKLHETPPHIHTMGSEVFELLAVKERFFLAAFKPAFAKVAHNHKIFHGREPHQYNYHFQEVMKEVKRLIAEHNEQQEEEKAPSVALTLRSRQQQVILPTILPKRSKHDRTRELF